MYKTPNCQLESQKAQRPNFAEQDQWETYLFEQKGCEMMNHSMEESFPCRAERRSILEQAKLVLAHARIVAEQSDRTLALLQGRSLEG